MITNLFVYHLKFRFLTPTKLPKASVVPEYWGSKIEKFPFLEKQLKVKITFERFTRSYYESDEVSDEVSEEVSDEV